LILDNSNPISELIAEGNYEREIIIENNGKFEQLKYYVNDNK